jgi:hypothetical protein
MNPYERDYCAAVAQMRARRRDTGAATPPLVQGDIGAQAVSSSGYLVPMVVVVALIVVTGLGKKMKAFG